MKKVLRRLGYVVATVLALLVLVVSTVYAVSTVRMRRAVPAPQEQLVVAADAATIERGRHVVTTLAKCVDCHAPDLGGQTVIDAPPLGVLTTPNLTTGRGGIGGELSDAQIEAAIRHGVRRDGKSLLFMPSAEFQGMSDGDVAAIIAYLRQVPPVDRETTPSKVGPLGRALFVANKFPLLSVDHVDTSVKHVAAAPPAGPTAEYGRYLVSIGCEGCHGLALGGGQVPGTPPEFKPAANLTPTGIGHYTEADFFRALREGVRPDGTTLDQFMPVRFTKNMTDDEIRAVYAYLKTVEPKPYGTR